MAAAELELRIKRYIVEAHKEITGIGPRNVFVQIVKNMLVIKVCGCFTLLEKRLLEVKGSDYVSEIRLSLFKAYARTFDSQSFTTVRIIDYYLNMFPENDSMHVFIVLEHDI